MPYLNVYAVTAAGDQVRLNAGAGGDIGQGLIPEGLVYHDVIAYENMTFYTVQTTGGVFHQIRTADGTIIATIHDSRFTGYGFTKHGSFRAFRGDKIIDIATKPGAPLKTVATLEGVTCADSSTNGFLWAANDTGDIALWKDSVLIQRAPTGIFKPRGIMTYNGFRAMMVATSKDGKIHFLRLIFRDATTIAIEDVPTDTLYWCDDVSSVCKGTDCMFIVGKKEDGTRVYHALYGMGDKVVSQVDHLPNIGGRMEGANKTILVDLQKVSFKALSVRHSEHVIQVAFACVEGTIFSILVISKNVEEVPQQAATIHIPGGSHNIHGFISDDPVLPMPACGLEPDIMFSDHFVQQDREVLQKKVEELERKLTIIAQLRRAAVKGETGSSYTDGRIKELERQLEASGKVLRETRTSRLSWSPSSRRQGRTNSRRPTRPLRT